MLFIPKINLLFHSTHNGGAVNLFNFYAFSAFHRRVPHLRICFSYQRGVRKTVQVDVPCW